MTTTSTASLLRRIPLAELHESRHNPRSIFDPQEMKELEDSMKASGQLTPLLVRPHPNGKGGYEIAAGACRRRVAEAAGLTHLDAIVRELDDATFVEFVNVENRQRNNLHALDEARGFADWMKTAGLKIPDIAARIGLSTKYVYDRLKLLQLIPEAQKLFLAGAFENGHAILLARIPPAEQKRAIHRGSDLYGSAAGLFVPDSSDGELALEFGKAKVKPKSVREFETWIKRHVRFKPEENDLENLFPETAVVLAQAAEEKRRHVFITHDHRVSDDAKDPEGKRTYGNQSWKRADGTKGSRTCDRSVVGVVAAGRGRGDAFLVCVNRDRCEVHYGPQVKARLAREASTAKRAAKGNGARPSTEKPAPTPKVDPNVLPPDLEQKWENEELTARVTKEFVPAIKGVIGELKIGDEICWNFYDMAVDLDRWNKVGQHGWQNAGSRHQHELGELVFPHLPGKFANNYRAPKDGAAARSIIALGIWLARDTTGLDDSIAKAVQARWKAHRAEQLKAEEKKLAKTAVAKPAKKAGKKKLAGDVARARAKQRAKAKK